AEALAQVGRRAVAYADAVHRQAGLVGRDLGQHGQQALPQVRRADVDGERAVFLDLQAGALADATAAAFDEAADGDAVVAALHQLALQRQLVVPAELLQAAVQRD